MTDRDNRPASDAIAPEGPATAEAEPPTFRDGVRFLYDRRVRLTARFALFLGLGAVGFALWLWRKPPVAEGRVLLTFPGIERGEYPSGKKFSVEDFRGADVLRAAAVDAGLPAGLDLALLSANIEIGPVIPPEVLARWKRQDRDGIKREEYVPNEFQMQIWLESASAGRTLRFFDALVKRYRERAKFEQEASFRFAADLSTVNYDDLVKDHDYWEIPLILDQSAELLSSYLKQLVKESRDFRDSRSHYSFRGLDDDLNIWMSIRLGAVKAMTFKGRLVKNKESALMTMQYRLEDLDVRIRQKGQEASEALRLLETAQKPQPLMASQSNGRDLIPVVDNTVLERILRSDYMPDLIRRITELQEKTKALEAARWRLEKDITYLPQAHNILPNELPAGYRGAIETMSRELKGIIERYNALLDSYLTDRLTSLVTVRSGPRMRRSPSALAVAAGVAFFAALLAFLSVLVQHQLRKA